MYTASIKSNIRSKLKYIQIQILTSFEVNNDVLAKEAKIYISVQ